MSDDRRVDSLPVGYLLNEYKIQKLLEYSEDYLIYLAFDTNLNLQVIIKEYFPERLVERENDYSLSVKESEFAEEYAKKLRIFLEDIKSSVGLRDSGSARVMRYFSVNRSGYLVTEYEENSINSFSPEDTKNPDQINEYDEDNHTENAKQKIVIVGSSGAGKSTAITTFCGSVTVDDALKLNRGKLELSNTESLLVYGTSGQDDFGSVWRSLQRGTIGIVLLIDNRRKDPLADLEYFLAKTSYHKIENIVIGITHVDSSRTPGISYFRSVANNLMRKPPAVFSVDTRNYQDMSMLLQALLYSQDPTMNGSLVEENSIL